jgi:hypothetical protein
MISWIFFFQFEQNIGRNFDDSYYISAFIGWIFAIASFAAGEFYVRQRGRA